MAGFSITINTADADRVARELAAMPKKIPGVLSAAINKSLTTARTQITRGITDVTTLKYGRALKGAKVTKATKFKLTGRVSLYGRGVGAVRYKHTKSKRNGVTVTFLQGDKPMRFRHAFKGVGASGNEHVFNRVVGSYYTVGSRANYLPNIGRKMERLKPVYGPSIFTIYQRNPKIERAARLETERVFSTELRRLTALLVGKGKA